MKSKPNEKAKKVFKTGFSSQYSSKLNSGRDFGPNKNNDTWFNAQ